MLLFPPAIGGSRRSRMIGVRRKSFAQFFFAHCENTYFDEDWWNSLTERDRRHMETLMVNSNPYYHPPAFELANHGLSPWHTANPIAA